MVVVKGFEGNMASFFDLVLGFLSYSCAVYRALEENCGGLYGCGVIIFSYGVCSASRYVNSFFTCLLGCARLCIYLIH